METNFFGLAVFAMLAVSFGTIGIVMAEDNLTSTTTTLENQTETTTTSTTIENQTDTTTTSTTTETSTTITTTTTEETTTTSTTIEEINETDNLTDDDEDELENFVTPPGARLRFLQLERALTRNILIGTTIIEILEANHPDANLSELNIILDNMEDLLNETKNIDLNLGPIEVARKFVEIKKQSISLTHEFRDEARIHATQEDLDQIREAIKDLADELATINDEIKQARCEFNAQKVGYIMNATNMSDSALLEQIRNCNAGLEQVQNRIRNGFGQLNREGKINAVKNVKSGIINRTQERLQIMQQVREELQERLEQRRMEMIEKRAQIMNRIMEKQSEWAERKARILNESGFAQRAQVMEQVSKRLQQRSEWAERIGENASPSNSNADNSPNRAR